MRVLHLLPATVVLFAVLATPSLAQSGSFGNSLIVLDDELIIGEPTTNFRPGTVYTYRLEGEEWVEGGQLRAGEPQRADGFGTVLARAGSTLFVGQRAGPVHTFERDRSGWRHTGTLPGTERIGIQPEAGGSQLIPLGCNQYGYCDTDFGISLAAEGDWLLVGDPRGNAGPGGRADGGEAGASGDGAGAGVVHAFRRGSDGSWTAAGLLQPGDGRAEDRFGEAISLVGGRALIGAPGRNAEEEGTVERTGGVYEFVLEGDAWRDLGALEFRGERNAELGAAIAVWGDRAVVGAPGSGDDHGAAFLLQREDESGAWTQIARLAAFSSARGDRFGSAVAFGGGDIWIGAPTRAGIETGRVYAYRGEANGKMPEEARRIRLTDTVQEDAFGSRIAAGADLVAVTALGMHHGAGSVHVYRRAAEGGWEERTMLVSPPDALEPLVGDEQECTEGRTGPFDCERVDLVAFLPNSMLAPPGRERGVRLNDNWGWRDPETGREYALVGRNDGLAIVDVSDPVNPFLVADLPKTPNTPRSQLWRDMKVYRDHVFVVADGAGNHGLQILDLRRLRDLGRSEMPVTFEPDYHYDNVASVHNININEETGLAALVSARGGGETCGGGLHMLDVRDPLNPVFLGCHFDEQSTHDVQCATYRGPDERYQGRELCLKANGSFLSISDVTDWDNPRVVGRANYPNPGYLHQGWLTEDHRYFVMDDEADLLRGHVETTRTLIFDVSDVEDPVLARAFMGSFDTSAHNQYVRGDFTYQANYRHGLHVLDISDPLNPVEVGFFDTTPHLSGPGFSGAWSTYPYFEGDMVLVTSVQDGMFLLRKSRPLVP